MLVESTDIELEQENHPEISVSRRIEPIGLGKEKHDTLLYHFSAVLARL
jgi:hypothetical protein